MMVEIGHLVRDIVHLVRDIGHFTVFLVFSRFFSFFLGVPFSFFLKMYHKIMKKCFNYRIHFYENKLNTLAAVLIVVLKMSYRLGFA